jgi:hypothetical protein
MSLHINRFIDSIKAHESRGQRDFVMSMRDARDLHADITKLLLAMQNMQQQVAQSDQVVKVEVSGGSFKST